MRRHTDILGYLFMIYSALGFLGGLFILLVFAGIMSFVSIQEGTAVPMFLTGGIGIAFMVIVVLASLPGFLAGYGLIHDKSWGRPLAIIMGIIYLIEIPVGTALGVYALWVLFNEERKQCFRVV